MKLLRPADWIKSGFVLLPLVFSKKFVDLSSCFEALFATVFFSLAASSIYIVNDWCDIERDRQHPVKCHRPLASGELSKSWAKALLGMLLVILFWGLLQRPNIVGIIFIYVILNIAYSLVLKYLPVIDIFTIALGLVLRTYVGAEAIFVKLSPWMLVTVLCLALFLASLKRRQESLRQGQNKKGPGGRINVLNHYSVSLSNRYAEMAMTGTLLFYGLFVAIIRPELAVTILFGFYGFFRYWFLVEAKGKGESPTETLLSDWQLLFVVLIWLGACLSLS